MSAAPGNLPVQLRLTPKFIVAFLLLFLTTMELHELVHITVGRLLCGCWGERDFNGWSLCEPCTEVNSYWWLATLAGPVFSFGMMWLGMFWLYSKDNHLKILGFSFVFANIPFGRITTVMMGGGDEMVVIRNLMPGADRTRLIIICTGIVMVLGVPPVIKAYHSIRNKNAWLIVVGFLTLPLVVFLSYVILGLNSLIAAGFLSEPWIMGTPLLITLHTTIIAALVIALRKNLLAT